VPSHVPLDGVADVVGLPNPTVKSAFGMPRERLSLASR